MRWIVIAAAVVFAGNALAAGEGDHGLEVNHLEAGSVSQADGLAAWSRIHDVVSHPRCANCHTDEANIPMWSGPEYEAPGPHGMNINAGETRIGAELLPCQTCHVTSTLPNTTPHAAPHAGSPWMLAPVEFVWFGQPKNAICEQMRDPERNGGRDGAAMVEHIVHDAELKAFITWAFDPGAGREAAPSTMQEHLDDTIQWVAAGMPCPGD